jgi:hypothetical protein
MKNEFERDETKSQDFRGDGCYNCMNNPMYKESLEKYGKPPLDLGVFTEAMDDFTAAYYEVDKETFDLYWKHLNHKFASEEEFKEVMYTCIDTYPELPAIAEIMQTLTHIRMGSF